MFGFDKRRSKLIVNEKLQGMIVKTIVTYGIILVGIFLMAIYFISDQFIMKIYETSSMNEELKLNLYRELNYIVLIFFLLAVILTFAISYLSLRLSNRIAGPIFNINRALEKNLEAGTSVPIKLRDEDFFHHLAVNINKILARPNSK